MSLDDQASDHEARFLECALMERAIKADKVKLVYTGRCLFCDEDGLVEPLRFCDASCRDGYDREQALLARKQGKK